MFGKKKTKKRNKNRPTLPNFSQHEIGNPGIFFWHNETFEEERLIIYMQKNNLAAIFKNSIVI